jgi:uncharacterized protein (DUF2252 family)
MTAIGRSGGPSSAAAFADRQLALDQEATRAIPALRVRKQARMRRSAHAFFRGAAPLFYEVLAARPDLVLELPGQGAVVGDMHLENVGAYRGESGALVFDLNDFDDATAGPWSADVLRLATSTLLAARARGDSGGGAIRAVERVLEGWRIGVRGADAPPDHPRAVEALLANASRRRDEDLLDDRAPLSNGRRRFVRGERYLELPMAVAAEVPALLARYMRVLGQRAPRKSGSWTIEDAAWRVAGTGSLGVLRIAILIGRGEASERLVEFKEVRPSAVHGAFPASVAEPADRAEAIVDAARKLVADPPRLLAPVTGTHEFVGRRLFPQEDKLTVDDVDALPPLARHVGWLLGSAHRRGAAEPLGPEWSDDDLASLAERAIELAGLFEAVYLAWCRASDVLSDRRS